MRKRLNPSNDSSFCAQRRGSAFLLVLVVLVLGAGLMAGVQHHLAAEHLGLRGERAAVSLRGALLLGLQEGMRAWASDADAEVLHLGEVWAEPLDFLTDGGARVAVRYRDAGGAFDLNSLLLPEEMFPMRGPSDVLLDLLRGYEVRVPDAAVQAFREAGEPLVSPEEFPARFAEVRWTTDRERGDPFAQLVALPPPPSGMHRINLNTASPEVLDALTGGMLGAWVDTVVQLRGQEPLRSTGPVLDRLPQEVAAVLSRVVDVKSDHLRVWVSAEFDHTVAEVEALLRRTENGDVEVLWCRW